MQKRQVVDNTKFSLDSGNDVLCSFHWITFITENNNYNTKFSLGCSGMLIYKPEVDFSGPTLGAN